MTMRGRRDEEGFALVMALVAISVISIVFVAVLNNTATVAKSQEVLQEKRANDLAADGALDMAIVRLQNDTDIGTSGGSDGCNATAPEFTPLKADDPYVDPSAGAVTIKCATTTDYSGITDTSATGKPGDNVLLALGGVYGQGYRETPGAGNGGDTTVPYCDNFLIGTQGYCEVGIFVARGNAGQDTVRIRPNGSDSNSPLVASNGAIAADVTSTPRLQISGTQPVLAQARRECTGVTVPLAAQLVCGATGNPALNTPFFKDPFWQSTLASGVNAAQPQTQPVVPWTSWDAADVNHANDG